MNKDKLIMSFSEIRASDIALVGGKGANLGEMTGAGLPVPPGFCVTTRSYELFLESCEGEDEIFRRLAEVETDNIDSVREVGETVRRILLDSPVPEEVRKEIHRHLLEFREGTPFAVRSSATAEDLPGASFAGQQDTYLNVVGEEALIDAVRRCWASLFTDRAILYRQKNNFHHRDVKLSVVVQEMVMSEKSGIMFTADPVTGHRHTLTIDASYGLGEALVSGVVSPDSCKVDKRTGDVIEYNVGEKQIEIVPGADGGTETREIGTERRGTRVLSDEEINQLVDMGRGIERHYGSPQDIEWGITGGRLYLLQTRPITSLYPIEGLQRDDGRFRIFFSMGHQQSMTQPMTPLALSTLRTMLPVGHSASKFDNEFVMISGGRLYADVTPLLKHRILKNAVLKGGAQFDVLAPVAIKQIMKRKEFKKTRAKKIPFRNMLFAMGIGRRLVGALWFRKHSGFTERTNELCDRFMEEQSLRLEGMPDGPDKLEVMLDIMGKTFPFFLNWVPEAAAGVAAAKLLTKWSRKWLSDDELEALTLAIPGNVVAEMNLMIGDLADAARRSPALVEAFSELGDDGLRWLQEVKDLEGADSFLHLWEKFMSKYGVRGPSEIDIGVPRWYEDPLPVLRVVAEFLRQEEGSHRKHLEETVRRREEVFEKLIQGARKGLFGRLRVRRLRRMYHVMTEIGGMREHHKFLAVRMMALIKEHLKMIAKELVNQGRLDDEEDIWYLTWEELFSIWDDGRTNWEETIARRRTELEKYRELNPPIIITSDGESPVVHYQVEDAPEGALLGNPVSPGVVEGTVHVIHDPQRESLNRGEIMVAEFTDPGWTPLFINAGGLILEVGGSLTHGAVVAREYGIPAIVGVRDATHRLQTGQRVRIDGNRGIIELLEPEDSQE